jgi:hypothetical protein
VFVDLMRRARRRIPCGHVKRWLVARLIELARARL